MTPASSRPNFFASTSQQTLTLQLYSRKWHLIRVCLFIEVCQQVLKVELTELTVLS